MKTCLILGNNPQFATLLSNEAHMRGLKNLLREFIFEAKASGISRFCVSAENIVCVLVDEIFKECGIVAERRFCARFDALIAVWGCAGEEMFEAVRTASNKNLPFAVIDAETLSVAEFWGR